jgi:alpha-1,6-mannosyltransferase
VGKPDEGQMAHIIGFSGEALSLLHKLESPDSKISVHIDVLAAQTGISRFGQLHNHWM